LFWRHPEWHIKDDVLNHLDDGWDMMIAHPVCKYLANSGVKHLHIDIKRWPKLFEAAIFFQQVKERKHQKEIALKTLYRTNTLFN